MDVKQYMQTFPNTPEGLKSLEAFAKKAGTTVAYLRQLAGKHRKASAELAIALETASDCQITRSELRPDYWPPEKVDAA